MEELGRERKVANERCSIKPTTTVGDYSIKSPRETGKKVQNTCIELSQPKMGVEGKLQHLLTLSHQSLVKEFLSVGINSGPSCVGKVISGSPSTKTQLLANGRQTDL